ncbi:Fc.00g027760.m01.CDS01 [Cosmosporella sp. VM-42]
MENTVMTTIMDATQHSVEHFLFPLISYVIIIYYISFFVRLVYNYRTQRANRAANRA